MKTFQFNIFRINVMFCAFHTIHTKGPVPWQIIQSLGFRPSTTMTSLINTVFLWTITIWYIYFFVSVGPTKVMIRDFWRMVWQKRVCKIVMLTNLMEACKVHFWKYILVSQQYVKFTSTVKLIISNFMGLKAHWFEIT